MVTQLAQNYNVTIIDNNVIDLGSANGWSEKIGKFYKSIQSYKINNTYSKKEIGNCYFEYQNEYHDNVNDIVYIVKYNVDSGD